MRGSQVFVGKIQDLEIDFVAERKNVKTVNFTVIGLGNILSAG